jgi:asparagine synthase (glutamine-hydrolysing)
LSAGNPIMEATHMLQHLRAGFRKLAGRPNDGLEGMHPADRDLVARIRQRHLTYLSDRKLRSLAQACREAEAQALEGMFVEAGCALGGSSILIASLKRAGREFRVYDVFGMIPPPTRADTEDVHQRYRTIVEGKAAGIDQDRYYGYEADLYEKVKGNLRDFGIDCGAHRVSLIKGLLQDTMAIDGPVAFAHVDVDWYEPVKTCLERLWPRVVPGGSVILDDYHDWGGCRKAADEYLRGITGQFRLDDGAGSMKITRQAPAAN